MRTRAIVIISIGFLVWGLAIAREQTSVTTIRLGQDQIAKIVTAPGIVSRISFPEEVQEIICGDLFDANSNTGSFVIQRSGNDVFVKPVVAKGMSNLFVKTGVDGVTTYGIDLEIGPAAKAQRVVNIIDARPVAVKNSISRPRRVLALTPPVTKPITASSGILGELPNWIAGILNLSSSPMPEPPKVNNYANADIQLPRQATRRVAPDYPELARRVGAQGEVTVEVSINSLGKVVSAKAISGHLLLRNSAIQAARLWKFTPVLEGAVENQSVAKITFNFQSTYNLSGSYFYSIVGGSSNAPTERRR